MKQSACPLDCYDGCAVSFDTNFKASAHHPLYNKKLCVNFGHLISTQPLEDSAILDKVAILKEKINNTPNEKILFYKGSGNVGVMQDVMQMVFAKMGATIAAGSLCDGAGEAGIKANRTNVINPPFQNLIDCDLVIVWGRNLSVTSPHIYHAIKDKEMIVIDPVATQVAKEAKLHLQIRPKTDYLLALILIRFAFIEGLEDEDFLKSVGADYEEFYELSRTFRIKESLQSLGISLDLIGDFLHLIQGKKIALLIGLGVQKYFEGDDIVRLIDGFGAVLGLFNKPFGGVWYLSDSKHGFENPFAYKPQKTTPKPSVDFGSYELVFIQGANPLISAPNSMRVREGLQKSYVVYFGTTFNETAQVADLVLCAKTFMAKKDIRLSYATDEIVPMQKLHEEPNALSEYELACLLDEHILDEEYYLNFFSQCHQDKTLDSFSFIDEVDVELETLSDGEYFLITCKQQNGLNSQFDEDNFAYFSPHAPLMQNQEIILATKTGNASFVVKFDERLREDCVLLYAGNKKVNFLTTSMSSKSGQSAIYQEQKVKIIEL